MTLHQAETGTPPGPDVRAPAQRPPSTRGFSIRPAMTVLVLGLVILGVFVTIGIVSSHQPATVRTHGTLAPVPGSSLRPVPAAIPLSVISQGGEPPANVVNAVVLPADSVRTAHQTNAGGQYDEQVTFRSTASQGSLLGFFAAALKQHGWQVFSQGPAAHQPGTTEVLGKIAGSDGYYWEIGALVSPTTFAHGAAAGDETDFTIRLFQVPDTQ